MVFYKYKECDGVQCNVVPEAPTRLREIAWYNEAGELMVKNACIICNETWIKVTINPAKQREWMYKKGVNRETYQQCSSAVVMTYLNLESGHLFRI